MSRCPYCDWDRSDWPRDRGCCSEYDAERADTEAAHAKALAEALRDANAELGGCSPTSGGTDGQWCVNHHDYRWLGAECELTAAISLALAAYDKDHGACLHRVWLTIDPPVCADCGKVGDER